jgi:uncharacterized membrane protein HdeD (DUF308 family)
LNENVRHGWLILFLILFAFFYAAIIYSTTQPASQFVSSPYSPASTNFAFAVTYGLAGSLLAAGVTTIVLRILQVGLKRFFSSP